MPALDVSQLRYSEDEGTWLGRTSDTGLEITIAGDATRPDPERFAAAQAILPHFSNFEADARQFFLEFFKNDGTAESWAVENVEFSSADEPGLFKIYFSRAPLDTYGLYFARFAVGKAEGRADITEIGRKTW
jgi:hypothetical protein